jgi:hypothetical protein
MGLEWEKDLSWKWTFYEARAGVFFLGAEDVDLSEWRWYVALATIDIDSAALVRGTAPTLAAAKSAAEDAARALVREAAEALEMEVG